MCVYKKKTTFNNVRNLFKYLIKNDKCQFLTFIFVIDDLNFLVQNY